MQTLQHGRWNIDEGGLGTFAAAALCSTVLCWQSLHIKVSGRLFLAAALPRMHLVCCQTLHSSHSIIGRPSSFLTPHTHLTTQPSEKALFVENSCFAWRYMP